MNEKVSSKEKLIITASKLFQQQGYHATGLNQITKESGAPKGSLYYHFPDGKEQLALESIQLTTEFVARQIEEGLKQSDNPVIAIQHFISMIADRFQKEGHQQGVPIAAVALETSLISDELRKGCQEAYRKFQNLFAQKLVSGGFVEERAEQLAVVINSMIEGAFLLSFTYGDSRPLRLVAEEIPHVLRMED
ncbi:TetR/AcrR family transcriptional regulator [Bacillus kwashiorkori]|uniref:TetR/AcrR family transcriptional regulator n=1 Tax=Bacillus kwashiorkori TaxID=1522318 RepID=UPI00078455DF|nr:TetR/AcrR family transcriptional regulator [Bacillus kwashiorkori]